MKFIASVIGTLAIFGAAVVAQIPSSVPVCGQTCISNLLGQAASFGCVAASPDEAACLCGNATFTYGIRDCSNESCPDSAAAASVISYGIEYCSSAGVAIPTTIVSVTSGTIVPTSTGDGSGASSSAITTSSFVSTITTGGSTLTASGATTIFAGGAAGSASSSASSAASGAEASGSSALSSASASVSSAVASATSAAGSAAGSASSAAGSATSSAFAPHMTAAPAGLLAAAAGVAAMLL